MQHDHIARSEMSSMFSVSGGGGTCPSLNSLLRQLGHKTKTRFCKVGKKTQKHISVIDCLSLTSSLYMYPLTLTFTPNLFVTLMERHHGSRHSCNSHFRKWLFTNWHISEELSQTQKQKPLWFLTAHFVLCLHLKSPSASFFIRRIKH